MKKYLNIFNDKIYLYVILILIALFALVIYNNLIKLLLIIMLLLTGKFLMYFEYLCIQKDLYGENDHIIWLDNRLYDLYINKKNKITDFINQSKISTYIFSHILFSCIKRISSDDIENIFIEENKKKKFDNIDLIIGIETGGALISNCINYIRKNNDQNEISIEYINIKARSGQTTLKKFIYGILPSLTNGKIIFNSKIQSEEEFINKIKNYKGEI